MSDLEKRENRRKSIVGGMIDEPAVLNTNSSVRGRPKEQRELKKRISISVLPSLYDDIQKIAYIQRRSASELIAMLMEDYRNSHKEELEEYGELSK